MACNTKRRSRGREEGWIVRGMANNEGEGAIGGSDPGAGPDNRGKRFPRLQRLPAPKARWDRRREPPSECDNRGREEGVQARKAGSELGGRVLMSRVGFPTVAPPARTAAALRA